MPLQSAVPGHIGPCTATWLNLNRVVNRIDGGITGFFRNVRRVWWWPFPVKTGPGFHGIIIDNEVRSTALRAVDQ